MYGVTLRYKWPYLACLVSSAIVLVYISINGVLATSIGVGGLPVFLSIFPKYWLVYFIGMGITFAGSLILIPIMYLVPKVRRDIRDTDNGKGAIKFDMDALMGKFPSSKKEIKKEIEEIKEVEEVKEVEIPDSEKLNIIVGDHKVKRKLNCNSTDEVWEIYRVRKIGKERIILDKDYINRGIIQNLTEEICKDSIYQYIENRLNLKIAFAKKEITVCRVTEEDKEYLDINDYNVIVVVKSYTYLENGDLFNIQNLDIEQIDLGL